MRALDAFREVSHELDKFASPTFEVTQFNYFFNVAIDDYIANNYARYPLVQKDVDDIRVLLKTTDPALTITAKKADLPVDYRHMLRVHVNATFIAKAGKYAANSTKLFKNVERRFSNEEGYREENAYLKASHKSPYYELEGSKIVFDLGSNMTPTTAIIQYIMTPPVIYLSPNPADDFSQEDKNTTINYPSHVCRELITLCARKFLENIESPRYQTKLNEERLRAQ